jgi:hypothetical protein
MPLEIDPEVLAEVRRVYSTDLGLPEEWTEAQREAFCQAEADKITWMIRSETSVLGDNRVEQWIRAEGSSPSQSVYDAIWNAARAEASRAVLSSELYEYIED